MLAVEWVDADRARDLHDPGGGQVAQVVGGGRGVVRRGVGARAAVDPVDLECVREVLTVGVAGTRIQVVSIGVGHDHRTPDALAGEEHFVITGSQGTLGEELQFVDAFVVLDGAGIRTTGRWIFDRGGKVDRRKGDLLSVLAECPAGAVDQLHRLAGDQGRGIERAAEVDPDRQRRTAEDGRRVRDPRSTLAGRSPALARGRRSTICKSKLPVLPGRPLSARSGLK